MRGMRRLFLLVPLLVTAFACGEDAVDPSSEGTPSAGSDPAPSASTTPPSSGSSSSGNPAPAPTTNGACSGKTGASGDRTVKIMSGGVERTFNLHVPASYDATKKTPLVFLFHGYTENASGVASATHMAAVADAHGFVLAFPEGLSNSFNAGECCGSAVSSNVDDIGFTKDMITTIGGDYCIDDKRIFSSGFSNDGMFSYRLACELADKIAAVASVSGTLTISPDDCKPKRPISMLHIHGTSDLIVPYNGGGFGNNRSVAASTDALKTKDSCPSGDGTVVYTKDDVSCRSWSGCSAGTEVELCTVNSGGHQWPGGEQLPYGGSPSKNLNAGEAIAAFFEKHPMP